MDVPGMIEQDFRVILPEAADSLFLKWDKIYTGILEYAAKQNNWKQFLRLRSPSTDWYQHTFILGRHQERRAFCLNVLRCTLTRAGLCNSRAPGNSSELTSQRH